MPDENTTEVIASPERKPLLKTLVAKKQMIKALAKNRGIVAKAAAAVGIQRRFHYEWLKNDPKYKAMVDDIAEASIDMVEDALNKSIDDGIPSSIYFYLKCKGKHRGWIEKQEVEHSIGNLDSVRELINSLATKNARDY